MLVLDYYRTFSNPAPLGWLETHGDTKTLVYQRGFFWAIAVVGDECRPQWERTLHGHERLVNNAVNLMTQVMSRVHTMDQNGTETFTHSNKTVCNWEVLYDIHLHYRTRPHVVVGRSMLFMILKMHLKRKDYLWKISTSPLVFHSLTRHNHN